MTIRILGTEYSVEYKKMGDANYDGICDSTSKEIAIRSDNVSGVGNMKELQKISLRHEVIHAFMFESGLGFSWQHPEEFGHDETTVDWFARMYDKIKEVFEELGIA